MPGAPCCARNCCLATEIQISALPFLVHTDSIQWQLEITYISKKSDSSSKSLSMVKIFT